MRFKFRFESLKLRFFWGSWKMEVLTNSKLLSSDIMAKNTYLSSPILCQPLSFMGQQWSPWDLREVWTFSIKVCCFSSEALTFFDKILYFLFKYG